MSLHALMLALHSHSCRLRVSLAAVTWLSLQNCNIFARNRHVFTGILQDTSAALLRHVHKHSHEVCTQQGAAQVNTFSAPPHPTPPAACVPSLAGCQHEIPSTTAQKTTHRGSTGNTLCCPANRAPARSQQQCITAPPRGQC